MRHAGVRLENVRKFYGREIAVDGISLAIEPGEFVTLLGPSGSGKSTLLSCIAGFAIPNEGEIRIGNDRVTLTPAHKRNIGIVFQNYALFPHMTVAQNLAFPLRMRSFTKENIARRVEWALSLVQLTHLSERLPRQLSGGQQQRVALARAVIFEPALLLLDEPLSALDKNLRSDMQDEIRKLHRMLGTTIVFVTHDQEEAFAMSDRVAIINKGRLEQFDAPTTLYTRPASPFVSDFVGQSSVFTGRIVSDKSGTGFLSEKGLRLPLELKELPAGQQVRIAIRPEQVGFVAPGSGLVDGVVSAFTYAGDHTRYSVELPSGEIIQASHQNASGRPSRKPGDTVGIALNIEDVISHAADRARSGAA